MGMTRVLCAGTAEGPRPGQLWEGLGPNPLSARSPGHQLTRDGTSWEPSREHPAEAALLVPGERRNARRPDLLGWGRGGTQHY